MNIKDYHLECWDYYADMTGDEKSQLDKRLQDSLDNHINENYTQPLFLTVSQMIVMTEKYENAKRDNLMSALSEIVQPRERFYHN